MRTSCNTLSINNNSIMIEKFSIESTQKNTLIILNHAFNATSNHLLLPLIATLISKNCCVCIYKENNNLEKKPIKSVGVLCSLIEFNRKRYQKIVLWGYSIGASIALSAATTSKVDAVVAWSPYLSPCKNLFKCRRSSVIGKKLYRRLKSNSSTFSYQTSVNEGLINSDHAEDFYNTDPFHNPKISLNTYYNALFFNIRNVTTQLKNVPHILFLAEDDEITPFIESKKLINLESKIQEYYEYKGNHFDSFLNPVIFNKLAQETKKFLKKVI
jgi:alpha-beta hydrolase superfamily lysophospholipase